MVMILDYNFMRTTMRNIYILLSQQNPISSIQIWMQHEENQSEGVDVVVEKDQQIKRKKL